MDYVVRNEALIYLIANRFWHNEYHGFCRILFKCFAFYS